MTSWLLKGFLVTYFIGTLPVIAVFVLDDFFRVRFWDYVARQVNKFRRPDYVFVGDSLTAGGKNWGLRLDGNPVSARAFARDGFRSDQLLADAQQAAHLRPRYEHLLAGTNDAISHKPPDAFRADFEALVSAMSARGSKLVVTLIPLQGNESLRPTIDSYNAIISDLSKSRRFTIVNLNDEIAPAGSLLPQFSDGDGIHLSEAAYEIWTSRLKEAFHGKATN